METIYDRLRQWRWQRARDLNLPGFFILSNAYLAGVAAASPATLDELAACPGVGPKKLEQFGEDLLRQIARCREEGLEPGVLPPPPPETSSAELTEDDLAEIALCLRQELAQRLARRLKGRFSPHQIEEALRKLSPTA